MRLLRPRQWIKNGFVLAPVVFAGMYDERDAVLRALVATLLFCVGSSAVYVFNDLQDVASDRLHPRKRTRPLAAGEISVKQAGAVMGVALAAVLAATALWPAVGGIVLLYVAINFAYSLKLKHVPVVDLFALATGFVLRVWCGAVAIGVPLSLWMLITTLCLALYMASIKRRQEIALSGSESRRVLGEYTLKLLDRYAEISAVGAILFYSLYVIDVRPELAVTLPLVLFGVFRYWFIVESRAEGESPTDALYSDVPLMLTILLWAAACVAAIART